MCRLSSVHDLFSSTTSDKPVNGQILQPPSLFAPIPKVEVAVEKLPVQVTNSTQIHAQYRDLTAEDLAHSVTGLDSSVNSCSQIEGSSHVINTTCKDKRTAKANKKT